MGEEPVQVRGEVGTVYGSPETDAISPILITGAARSGTSLTAGILYHCGAWGGRLSGPTRSNPKGMYENHEIRQTIVKPYLKRLGVDPMGQNPLPNIKAVEQAPMPGLRTLVLDTIRRQGYSSGPWFYKGAKMCLIWPIWADAFPEAKWIIVRRDPEEVVDSCLRTPFMRAFKGREGWRAWVKVHEIRFQEMQDAGLDVREVWPGRYMGGYPEEAREMAEWVGLDWNDSSVVDFLSPELWHGTLEDRAETELEFREEHSGDWETVSESGDAA